MNINDWKEQTRQKELAHWKNKHKYTVRLCKAVYSEIDSIKYIKEALSNNDDLAASEAWNELEAETQRLLITAPTFGGPFTTNERARIIKLWEYEESER